MEHSDYINKYLQETAEIAKKIDQQSVGKVVGILAEVRARGGRVFFLGVGGGAATGSHATNDFNKIARIPTVCLSDNPGLLTSLVNDEGWDSIFKRQLEMQRLTPKDCLFIYSVGGGTATVSKNLVLAVDYAKAVGAKIVGVVGKDTGVTAQKADAYILVPTLDQSKITPHTEDFQLVIDHIIANLLAQIPDENIKEA